MGLSNKTQKQQSHSETTSSSTMQRTNPAWVTDSLKGYTDRVTGLMGQDPASVVPGANPLQKQAADAAAGLGGWRGAMNEAQAMTRAAGGGAGASSLLSNLDDYISPYTDAVVDTTLSEFDDTTGEAMAGLAARGARNRAFGGSRFGVAEGTTLAKALKDRAGLEAGLRDTSFSRGAELSDRDAARRQQTELANQQANLQSAGLMGQLAGLFGSNARSDVATQSGVGGDMRDIDLQQSPLGVLGALGDLLGKGQFDLLGGAETTGNEITDATGKVTSSGGLLGSIGSALSAGASLASLFSDARAKRDVVTLGHDDRGRRWVEYRYLWDADDAPKRVGVMAQEVAETDPEAVHTGPLDFLMVDYSKLTETGEWRAS